MQVSKRDEIRQKREEDGGRESDEGGEIRR